MLHSYPQIYAIGHKAIENLFDGEVQIEEKIDGSQFSFGIVDGEVLCRSKGAQLVLGAPERMFVPAIETIMGLANDLHNGWVYRAEFLAKPKHNTLAYDRIPAKYLIGFDIQTGLEQYMGYEEKAGEFARLGLETVPLLYRGVITGMEMFKDLLNTQSILGGQLVEGVVVKNYAVFSLDKKAAMGKFVSEKFKEIHGGEWRKNNPTGQDIIQQLIERYRTPARWQKAVQHLRERGELTTSPRDISALMMEIKADTRHECEDEVKNILFAHFWKNIERGIIAGLPEWYKEQLLESAFKEET